MADLTIEEKHLLRQLKSSYERGAASMEVRGKGLDAAHSLRQKGLAQWHGESWGSHFYYITWAGLETDLRYA